MGEDLCGEKDIAIGISEMIETNDQMLVKSQLLIFMLRCSKAPKGNVCSWLIEIHKELSA